MNDETKMYVLSQIPVVINVNSSSFSKIIIQLLTNISGQEYYSENWPDYMSFVSGFKESDPVVFLTFHAAISKMLMPSSLCSTKEMMQAFVGEISEYASCIEDESAIILVFIFYTPFFSLL